MGWDVYKSEVGPHFGVSTVRVKQGSLNWNPFFFGGDETSSKSMVHVEGFPLSMKFRLVPSSTMIPGKLNLNQQHPPTSH